ncbi:MAG: transposase [Alphaproteobacteria bacterium]|nr:transposase [Alphaproteobacteria bacterium]
MKIELGKEQPYNAHAVFDADHQIIVAQGQSNQPPNVEYLPSVVGQVEASCGEKPVKMSGDAGYWSRENAAWCREQETDAYIAVRWEKHGPPVDAGPPPGSSATSEPPPTRPDPDSKERMTEKLRTAEGWAIYRLRKTTLEPVFGQIKEARALRWLLLCGMEKVRDEWALVCTALNLLKLCRYEPASGAAG